MLQTERKEKTKGTIVCKYFLVTCHSSKFFPKKWRLESSESGLVDELCLVVDYYWVHLFRRPLYRHFSSGLGKKYWCQIGYLMWDSACSLIELFEKNNLQNKCNSIVDCWQRLIILPDSHHERVPDLLRSEMGEWHSKKPILLQWDSKHPLKCGGWRANMKSEQLRMCVTAVLLQTPVASTTVGHITSGELANFKVTTSSPLCPKELPPSHWVTCAQLPIWTYKPTKIKNAAVVSKCSQQLNDRSSEQSVDFCVKAAMSSIMMKTERSNDCTHFGPLCRWSHRAN